MLLSGIQGLVSLYPDLTWVAMPKTMTMTSLLAQWCAFDLFVFAVVPEEGFYGLAFDLSGMQVD
jgi:hypothetical protein